MYGVAVVGERNAGADSRVPGLLLLQLWHSSVDGDSGCSDDRFADNDCCASLAGSA